MNALTALLANAAFFYPIYWLSMFLVRAGPPLLHVGFLGHKMVSFYWSPLWIMAECCPPGTFVASHSGRAETSILEPVLVIISALAIYVVLSRRHRTLAGLLIAAIGQAALTDPLVRLLFGSHSDGPLVLRVVLYGVTVLLGLALVASSVEGRYLKRLAAPAIGFCLPLAVFSTFRVWLGAPWVIVAVLAGPSLLMAAVGALWNRSGAARVPEPVTWRRLAAGLALSLLLAGAIRAAENVRDRSRESARAAFRDGIPKTRPSADYPKKFFQKGVNFTAEGPVGYDPQSAVPMLDRLKQYGVDSIALVPYGFAATREPSVRFPGGMERSDDIAALTALAHHRGMKVFLKPQLWTRDGFPGTLEFRDPGDRARWFAEYRKFVEYYAALSARIHADLFAVGVELSKMTPHEAEWRSLISRARELYPGPLVYAAVQGPEFEGIRFWDALDYIGLNEYYPLPDDFSTAALIQKVEAVHNRYQRPVLLTEAGFASLENPHRAPWDETPRKLSPAHQARCYEMIFKAFYGKPWFDGMYWWKVGTNGFGGPEDGSHTPWGKPAMDVVKRWYVSGGR